jgi:hypothetical protein
MNVKIKQCKVRKSTNGREAKTELDQWQRRKALIEILIRLIEQHSELVDIGKYIQRSKQKHKMYLFFCFKRKTKNLHMYRKCGHDTGNDF